MPRLNGKTHEMQYLTDEEAAVINAMRMVETEAEKIERLLFDLLKICVKEGMNFEYLSSIGLVCVMETNTCRTITRGYIKDWELETPVEALENMHNQINEYKKATYRK